MAARDGWLRPFPSGRTWLLLASVSSLCVMGVRAWLAGDPPVGMSLFSVFSAFGYASVAVHFAIATGRDRWLRVGAAAGGATGLVLLLLGPRMPVSSIAAGKTLLTAVGAAGVLAYLRDAAKAGSALERRASLSALRDALIVPAAVAQVGFYLGSQRHLNPVYDAYVYVFERALGRSFEYVAMAAYGWAPPIGAFATACYLALPVALVAVYVKQPSFDRQTRVLLAFLAAGVSGFLLYRICPVVGPSDAFAVVYPARLPALAISDVRPIWTPGEVPRNGMPSLHAAWALLILFNMGRFSWRWRAALGAFVAFSLWAAVARYQHWVLDLVVAVPFAAAIQLLVAAVPGERRSRVWIRAAACGLLVFFWLVGLRSGWWLQPPGWLAWGMVAGTIVLPLWLVRASVPTDAEADASVRH